MWGARRLVVLFVFCLFQSIAAAQGGEAPPSDEARAEASSHFRRGVELFQEEAYRAALVEFQRAYDIAPDYRLLYNIGQTKLLLQDFLGAAQSYDGYLTGGGSSIPPERRAQVEEGLASMQQRVGRLGISVNRAGADLFVDDLRVGTSPLANAVLVNVGRHRVSARTADGATEAKMVDVAGGDVAEVTLELSAPIAAAAGPVQPASPWTPLRVTAVVGWSVGAAALIGGAVTGALANKADGDLDKLLDSPSNDPALAADKQKQVSDKRDSLKTYALLTDVLLPVGGALAVVGTVLWFVDAKKDKQDEQDELGRATKNSTRASLQWNLGPSSVSLRGRF